MIFGPSVTGVSDDGVRYGILQFGDQVYEEIPLGSAHNLREFVRKVLNIAFRNDDKNDITGALKAAREILETR